MAASSALLVKQSCSAQSSLGRSRPPAVAAAAPSMAAAASSGGRHGVLFTLLLPPHAALQCTLAQAQLGGGDLAGEGSKRCNAASWMRSQQLLERLWALAHTTCAAAAAAALAAQPLCGQPPAGSSCCRIPGHAGPLSPQSARRPPRSCKQAEMEASLESPGSWELCTPPKSIQAVCRRLAQLPTLPLLACSSRPPSYAHSIKRHHAACCCASHCVTEGCTASQQRQQRTQWRPPES